MHMSLKVLYIFELNIYLRYYLVQEYLYTKNIYKESI